MTELGNVMSGFPLDPQLAKTLIESSKHNCANATEMVGEIINNQNVLIQILN